MGGRAVLEAVLPTHSPPGLRLPLCLCTLMSLSPPSAHCGSYGQLNAVVPLLSACVIIYHASLCISTELRTVEVTSLRPLWPSRFHGKSFDLLSHLSLQNESVAFLLQDECFVFVNFVIYFKNY